MAFMNYENVFDSVKTHHSVLEALQEQGINSNYIKLIRDIHRDNCTTVCLHKNSNKIKIKKGVRQEDIVSPKLFIAYLEKFFRIININGEELNHLRFADDIILIAHAIKDSKVMLQELDNASRTYTLKGRNHKNKQSSICKWNPT